jgi:hypothetical protein
MPAEIFWYEDNGVHKCERNGVIVGKIRYAQPGEAEGGLGALIRFMGAALNPQVSPPPLSPEGWYWQATATRGVWSPPRLANDIESARQAVELCVSNL